MNKQPFYHQTELDKPYDENKAIGLVSGVAGVLKDTVELVSGELLFTATADVCQEVQDLLMKAGVVMVSPVYADAGDPADLM